MAEEEAGIFQNVRRQSGRLPRGSLSLFQLLISLIFFLVLLIILAHADAREQQIQAGLQLINQQLAQINDSLERLCRACPWGWEHFRGSCYLYSRSAGDWLHAMSACRRKNSQLVIVNSAPEAKFLQFWEVQKKGLWIGLSDHHDEGSWQWIDGSPLNISFWKPGEPNNEGDEDCVELYNDGWNDIPCSQEKPWICEKPAVSCSQP
ncbi:CD209 antigen-like protein C [Sorex fumeus]|uniref:CD209 antigen-like protein C n=1 Tax=Sorex fumeus TaxID=62283 RepID=UPI0024AE3D40|nr:CD209 antigen-like protein C [Sorex fumeus]